MNYELLGFKIYYLAFYFIIFSFAGWLMETIRVSIRNKSFVNRGFINGPFCPIYGVGMNIIILFLSDYKNNYFLLGLLGMVLASVLEYLTSFALEKLFHESWWDYSYRKFNINGRISLDISVAWGVLSLIMIELIVPLIDYFIKKIDFVLGEIIIYVFFIYFFFDLSITIYHLLSLNAIKAKLRENKEELMYSIYLLKNNMKNKLDTEELKLSFENKYEQFISKYFDREQFSDFKMEFKEFFKDISEKLVEEPFEKINLQSKINKYKERYNMVNKRTSNFIYKRILRAFPNIEKKHKNRKTFVQEIKKYINERKWWYKSLLINLTGFFWIKMIDFFVF